MEEFKGARERTGEYDWYKEIDWHGPDIDRQISLFYADTCDQFRDRPNFKGVFHRLTVEFMEKHPGPAGDKIFSEWMITRLRKEFLGRLNDGARPRS
jgi:hypothetical protein